MSPRSGLLFLLTWVVSFGCSAPPEAVEPWAIDEAEPSGPPLPQRLRMRLTGQIVPGSQLLVEIDGATPNGQVMLVFSDGAIGAGACPRVLRGGCLGIRPGSGYHRVTLQAGPTGLARRAIQVPPWIGPGTWVFQAVDPSQPAGSRPVLRAVAMDTGPDTAATQVQQADSFYMAAHFAYDPATDQAVGWHEGAGQPETFPFLHFTIGTYDGVVGDTDESCDVVLSAPGPLPRASWATFGGAWLFGLDFDPALSPPTTTRCGPAIDPASVDAMVQQIVTCQVWKISVDSVMGPDTLAAINGSGLSPSDYLGANWQMDLNCGWSYADSEGLAYGVPLAPGRVSFGGPNLSGPARTIRNPAGFIVPAEGLWSVASTYAWRF